jgi:hypothetical protein
LRKTLGYVIRETTPPEAPLEITQPGQSCQMVYFQTIYPSLGKFWKVLQWKMLVQYFMAILSILQQFCIFCGYLVYFSRCGMLYRKKSANPEPDLNGKDVTKFCEKYFYVDGQDEKLALPASN